MRDIVGGSTVEEPADGLFVLIGGAPRTDWLPHEMERSPEGYVLTGPDVATGGRRQLLETSIPALFAAGDVTAGSITRVASAAGEGAMVVAMVHQHLLLPL